MLGPEVSVFLQPLRRAERGQTQVKTPAPVPAEREREEKSCGADLVLNQGVVNRNWWLEKGIRV